MPAEVVVMRTLRNIAALVFLAVLLSFPTRMAAKNLVAETDCSAYSAIGPSIDQAAADDACDGYRDTRDCDADCVEDNTPTSIHGSECDAFYYTIESSNTCESLGQGDMGFGFGYYTGLRCLCFWDFPSH
jgi:hypothetical protein